MTNRVFPSNQAQYSQLVADLELLQTLFPVAFPRKGAHHARPLKVGIHTDILTTLSFLGIEMTRSRLRRALTQWCTRRFYYHGILVSGLRFDLGGLPVGSVSLEDKASARVGLIERDNRKARQQLT
ncbi:sRNA-binding protein [Pseudomonas nitritireducens]|uniref:SRNA-binding protein n=1 Tax=Pseudomonas nitroreducens TaxID=46680 RepID=A0A7W7KM65_PSENT|nr:ProQ/FINO family protein [Pseudomonas nitritireducens]MBB4865382.1 sRNA-binding protein [Pseudomonas nitritireducens]